MGMEKRFLAMGERTAGSENSRLEEQGQAMMDSSQSKKEVLICLVSIFSKPKIGTVSDEYEYTQGHNGTKQNQGCPGNFRIYGYCLEMVYF